MVVGLYEIKLFSVELQGPVLTRTFFFLFKGKGRSDHCSIKLKNIIVNLYCKFAFNCIHIY